MPRDLKVLKLILQQKAVNRQHLLQTLFQNRADGLMRVSDIYVKRRLNILASHGLILKTTEPYGRQKVYCISRKGVGLLAEHDPNISINTKAYRPKAFEIAHTLKLMDLRVLLTQTGVALDWIPERFIRSTLNLPNFVDDQGIPDALYLDTDSNWVALEYERARKDKGRYETKLSRLMDLIRNGADSEIRPKKILFICEFDLVFRQIFSLAMPYFPFVEVMTFEELNRKLLKGEVHS
jgi:hypothetical protein